jgi:hypothetical protein
VAIKLKEAATYYNMDSILPHELAPGIAKWLPCETLLNFSLASKNFNGALRELLRARKAAIEAVKAAKSALLGGLKANVIRSRDRLSSTYAGFMIASFGPILGTCMCQHECCSLVSNDIHIVLIGDKLVRYGTNKYNNNSLHIATIGSNGIKIVIGRHDSYKVVSMNHRIPINLKLDKCYDRHYNMYYQE